MFQQYDILPFITPRTRFISVGHVNNTFGTINDVKRIIDIAHSHDIPVLIDGAQSIAHTPADVQALDADFFVFSGHKIYGPNGIGVVYGKIGLRNIEHHEHILTEYARQQLSLIPGLTLLGDPKNRVSVVSFVLDGIPVPETGKLLDREGIAVRAGHTNFLIVTSYMLPTIVPVQVVSPICLRYALALPSLLRLL